MIQNINDLLAAQGPALTQPLAFGKFAGRRLYEVPVEYYDYLAKSLKLSPQVFIDKAREAKQFKLTHTLSRPPYSPLTHKLPDDLFAWQARAIERFGSENIGIIHADVGTGKTRWALEYLKVRWLHGDKVLVFCPKNVFSSWQNGIKKYAPHFRCIAIRGTLRQKLELLDVQRDIYLINYESLLSEEVLITLERKGFTWMFLDESHKVKNYKLKTKSKLADTKRSSQSGACMRLAANIEMKFELTGTWIANDEKDTWAQVTILDGGQRLGYTFARFYKNYFTKGQHGYYAGEFKEQRRAALTQAIAPIYMRVEKSKELDLPEMIQADPIECEMTGDQLKAYLEMEKEAVTVLQDEKITAEHKIVEMVRLRQICGGGINDKRLNEVAKLSALKEVLEDIKSPVAIVCVFRAELESIKTLLKSMGSRFGYVQGGMKDAVRDSFVSEFSAGRLDHIVLQIDAGGVGIDGMHNFCSNMIFYSNTWKWDAREQAVGRIHRPGIKTSPVYQDLVSVLPVGKNGKRRESMDEYVMACLQNKDLNIRSLISGFSEVLASEY
jgi:SNF2 family DNA or RNA helicase